MQPAARERCDRNSKHPDCLQGRRHSTLRCGLCGRGHLSYPSAASRYCQKRAKSVGSHRHHAPDFHVFSGPIYASGFPYSSGALHVNSPHTSARLSPCAGAVLPYVSTATPYSHQAPKTQLQFQRDQRFRPRKSPTPRARPWHAQANPPRPAAGPLKPTHPTRLLRFHRPTPGGHVRHRFAMRRRQRRRRVGVDDRGGGAAPACMIGPSGLKASPPDRA